MQGINLGVEDPVIDPKAYIEKEGIALPTDRCILTFNSRITREIASFMKNAKVYPIRIPIFDPTIGEYDSARIFVATLIIGAPASVMALELLIAAGAREIIVIGMAGSICPEARIGDIFLPTWGLREEGTSYHYMPPDYIPRPGDYLVSKLKNELKRISPSVRILTGGVWSTDAVFRETKDKIRKYRKLGIIGVDMESTALMTVAEYRRIKLAMALIISDELSEKSWKHEWNSESIRKSEQILALASLKTLVQ